MKMKAKSGYGNGLTGTSVVRSVGRLRLRGITCNFGEKLGWSRSDARHFCDAAYMFACEGGRRVENYE
jgi:hypothetical protein